MGITKRPPKDELIAMKKQGMSDREIAKIYGVKRMATVTDWRRQYDVRSDGSYWSPNYCPHCERYVSQFLEKGVCPACNKFQRQHNRSRTKADMVIPGGTTGWCKRCKEAPAYIKKLCRNCYDYRNRTGKDRPQYLIRRDKCKNPNCNRPWQSCRFRRGYCQPCRRYKDLYGVDRPVELCRKTGDAWCDCGHPATHLGVELPIQVANGRNVIMEKYDLCDDCMALELES